jgi:hypothetical protein
MRTSGNDDQEATMDAAPRDEHRWLEQWVGEWRYESEASMGPGKPPERSTGTETVRSLGGLWVVCEGRGTMPGCGAATMLMTVGYNTARRRFVGTWCGSMMTHLWIYDGALDTSGRVLTLESEGPAFSGEGLGKYRDVMELASRDERVLTSHALGEDGVWRAFMTAKYRRTPAQA